MIKGALGEDLWFLKDGVTPRQRMCDQHVVAMISDGDHVLADMAVNSLHRMMPISYREREGWVDYALVGEGSRHTGYRKEYPDFMNGGRATRMGRSFLLNHLFMVRSVLPCFKFDDRFDSLLIDVDVEMEGYKHDLYRVPAETRVEMMSPWLEGTLGLGLSPLFMLSGGRGFWVQIFWDEPISRAEAEVLFSNVCRESGATLAGGDDHWRMVNGEISYCVDAGNLAHTVCRLPWSMKESYGGTNMNVSIHVDPLTGEPRLDHLIDLPVSVPKPELYRVDDAAVAVAVAVQYPPLPPHDYCGDVCETEGAGEITADAEKAVDLGAVAVDTPAPPPHDHCGDVCETDVGCTAPRHLDWDWRDIITEAEGGPGIVGLTHWRDLIADAPDGSKFDRLVKGGNIALVSARMKHELGYVDWEALKSEYEIRYAGSDQSKGGTISEWIGDWKEMTAHGATIIPSVPRLGPEQVARCRSHAKEIVAKAGRARHPSVETLFRVLLVLMRLGNGGQFEASTDFLARKSGINPYRTWEAQEAVEGVIARPGDRKPHVRHNPSSVAARKRLMTALRHVCDLDAGTVTGKHPFSRAAIGSNDRSDERVAGADRAVGSIFERVPSHPFWEASCRGPATRVADEAPGAMKELAAISAMVNELDDEEWAGVSGDHELEPAAAIHEILMSLQGSTDTTIEGRRDGDLAVGPRRDGSPRYGVP